MEVDDAEGVGADDPHAIAACEPQQLLLAPLTGRPGLGKPRRYHQQGLDTGCCAVLDHQVDRLRRDSNNRKVNLIRDLAHP